MVFDTNTSEVLDFLDSSEEVCAAAFLAVCFSF